jgi:hypothetical protein
MPKKENRKGQKGIRIRNKVIVNVNTGRSSRRPSTATTSTQRPISSLRERTSFGSSGSSAPVVILQPQPQITPQNQLQPQLSRQLPQLQQYTGKSGNVELLEEKIKKLTEDLELETARRMNQDIAKENAVNKRKDTLKKNKDAKKAEEEARRAEEMSQSEADENLQLQFPDIKKAIKEMDRRMGRSKERESTVDAMSRLIREPTLPPPLEKNS